MDDWKHIAVTTLTRKPAKKDILEKEHPEPNYYLELLGGMLQTYAHAAAESRAMADGSRATFYQAKADAIGECIQHYRELHEPR